MQIRSCLQQVYGHKIRQWVKLKYCSSTQNVRYILVWWGRLQGGGRQGATRSAVIMIIIGKANGEHRHAGSEKQKTN